MDKPQGSKAMARIVMKADLDEVGRLASEAGDEAYCEAIVSGKTMEQAVAAREAATYAKWRELAAKGSA